MFFGKSKYDNLLFFTENKNSSMSYPDPSQVIQNFRQWAVSKREQCTLHSAQIKVKFRKSRAEPHSLHFVYLGNGNRVSLLNHTTEGSFLSNCTFYLPRYQPASWQKVQFDKKRQLGIKLASLASVLRADGLSYPGPLPVTQWTSTTPWNLPHPEITSHSIVKRIYSLRSGY